MIYYSEAEKIKPLIEKYLEGTLIDIGCADHKIVPHALGIDGRSMDGVNIITSDLYSLYERGDIPISSCVFSSHTLEHLTDDTAAIKAWSKLIFTDGYLILYLPDGRYYDNNTNPEHMRDYTYDNFMFYFKRVFCGEGYGHTGEVFPALFKLIESGQHIDEDCYSFYLVAQRI